MRFWGFAGVIAALFPVMATAQALNATSAAKQLFPVKGSTVVVSSSLSARDKQIAQTLVTLLEQQQGEPIYYYFSIAYSPADGWASESLQSANNFHSVAAADAAAMRACDAAKSGGTCTVVARVVPKSYKERDLTMSVAATEDFRRRYRRAGKPKAFAISPGSGAWGIGTSDAGAISDCGVTDCTVVIRD